MKEITLYSPDDAAKLLGMSKQTLAAWRMRGDGPKFLKFGNRIRYSHDKIEEFLEQHTQTHTGQSGGQSA